MRLDHPIVTRHATTAAFKALTAAALCTLLALPAFAGTMPVQSGDDPANGRLAAATAEVLADADRAMHAAMFDPMPPAFAGRSSGAIMPQMEQASAQSGQSPADARPRADSGRSQGAAAAMLDDEPAPSRQRGGMDGMVRVVAKPALAHRGSNVTLWDEIAPPAPLPVPVDNTKAAQNSIASYTKR